MRALSFLPDGRTIVSGANDGSVCFWDDNGRNRASSPMKIAISLDPAREAQWLLNRFGVAFTSDSRNCVSVYGR